MKLAVISDLHMGRGDAHDPFGHDDGEFLRFLRFLEAEHERVVLLGDIWETLTAPRGPRRVAELEACHAAHPEIARRLAGPSYVYVHGNHDAIALSRLGALPDLSLERDGVRLLFTHGHLHDWAIRRIPRFAELAARFGAWVRRVGMHTVYQLLDRFDALVHGNHGAADASFERWALGQADRHAADVVIAGHTHRGGRWEREGTVYLNTGTCSGGALAFASVDTTAGTYRFEPTW